MMISFTVKGDPQPQPRPRMNTRTGHTYNPPTANAWKALVAAAANGVKPREPLTGPVDVEITLAIARPKSHRAKSGKLKSSAPMYHIQTPDLDNFAKAICDVLTRCEVWKDDSQIVRLCITKKWSFTDSGGASVHITECDR